MSRNLSFEGSLFRSINNVNDLAADIEDVTDPSSMDKVLVYLEQLQEEDEEFMQLLTEKLKYVEVYWEQPWYQKSYCLSRRLKETAEGEETDMYRTDTICKEEHDLIEKNWHKFRRKFGIPDKLVCFARWKNIYKTKNPNICPEERTRRYVTAYLARKLKRNNYQVYNHIVAHYGGYNKGFFSSTEEKIIEVCYYHKPKLMGKILAVVLGRQCRGVNKKLMYMQNGKPEKKRLKWTLPLATKFLQLLIKHSGLEFEELKNRTFEREVWQKLEEDMEQYSCHLHHFWYCNLHVQLFVRCDVKLNELKKKLFQILQASSYQVWSDIRWKDIVKKFPDGFTPRFLYRISSRAVKTMKGYLKTPLAVLIEYALKKFEKGRQMTHNKRLKTLKLNKKGMLEIVEYRKMAFTS